MKAVDAAYRDDFETENLYVYGRILNDRVGIWQALLNLERDLWVPPATIARGNRSLDGALNDAASAVPDATQWYPATRNLIRELLRCAERGGGRDDRGTIACQRLICRGTELAPPDSDKPPTGRETNRPLRVPDLTPWPCDLVDASIRIACSCGGGGGGDPCEGVVCGNDNLCTDDWCSNGFCGHTPILCPPTDNNPCADHKCDSGDCVTIFNSAPCDDGNPCTQDDTCSFGGCAGTPIICPELPCNSGACLSGICKYTPVAGACDDDGNLCTDDVCAGGTCTNPPNSDPCDDEDPCTVDDTCSAGSCSGT